MHFVLNQRACLFYCGLYLLLICGCSGEEGPPLYKVSGTVKLDGAPLEKGAIVFDADGDGAIPSQGGITDGHFEFESTAGNKIVRIYSTRESDEKGPYGEPVSVSIVPRKYGTDSTMKEVVKEEENVYSFDLES